MTRRALRTATCLGLCLLSAGAYDTWPLFRSNQNSYFVHGLARAGYGHLAGDWLARQTDHVPVFTWMVSWVHTHAHHTLFTLLFYALAAAYVASLASIAVRPAAHPTASGHTDQLAFFLALLTLLHRPGLLDPLVQRVAAMQPLAQHLRTAAAWATEGVAGQYILGPYLQPSAFGVLLLASVAFFVRGRHYAAVVCAVLSATVHPTYALHAAALTASYMIVLLAERTPARALKTGALALLLILPIVLYVALALCPADPQTLARAQAVLVERRIPHHARVAVWWGAGAAVQLGIVLGGMVLAAQRRRLVQVLALCTAAAVALTLLQVASGNRTLALLFPWRLSAWLVPLCAAILVDGAAAAVFRIIDRRAPPRLARSARACLLYLSVAFLAGSCFFGVQRTLSAAAGKHPDRVAACAAKNAAAGQIYLVPLRYEDFRLASGRPVFVDWKAHPFRDVDVLAWFERVRLARAFYRARSPEDAARALDAVRRCAPVTHVVVERGDERRLEALHLPVCCRDGKHALAALPEAAAGEASARPAATPR